MTSAGTRGTVFAWLMCVAAGMAMAAEDKGATKKKDQTAAAPSGVESEAAAVGQTDAARPPVTLSPREAPATSARLGEVVIVVDKAASELEQLAAREVRRYVKAITGSEPPLVEAGEAPAGKPAIVLTTMKRPLGQWALKAVGRPAPNVGAEGFWIRTFGEPSPCLLVTGETPVAVVYGAYELLEQYGIRFYLSDEVLPAPNPDLRLKTWDLVHKPDLAIRGTLPWYNFLMGPTAWRLEDYKAYIDQLLKMKYNMLGLHFYVQDPFFHFSHRGVTAPEESLLLSGHPVVYPTGKITIGKEHFAGDGQFMGAPGGTDLAANERVVAEALAYARSRGFKLALGLELDQIPPNIFKAMPDSAKVGGRLLDPTSAEADAFLRERLKALVAMYPQVDYYWFWYTEHKLWDGVKDEELSPALREFWARNRPLFDYPLHHVSARGALGYLCWMQKAHAILRELKPGARILTGGWTIDAMFPGLDKALPADVALSSLSGYEPQWAMQNLLYDRYWKGIDRTRLVVSWFEFDGRCVGCPQPKVRIYWPFLNKVKEAGIDGVLMLHWRTRVLDMNARYFAENAWGSRQDAYEFYVDYARSRYGEAAAEEARRAHLLLEDYEEIILSNPSSMLCNIAYDYGRFPPLYGDMPDDIQVSAPPAALKLTYPEDNFQRGYAILLDDTQPLSIAHAAALLKNARYWFGQALAKAQGEANQQRLRYTIGRVDYYILYLESYRTLLSAWVEYRGGVRSGDAAALPPAIDRALALARKAPVEATVRKYAEFITNRGEKGVLVSLNRKVWDRYQLILSRLEEARRAATK